MDNKILINFKVTPSQKETINLRVAENGFDEISSYVKVLALKMRKFHITSIGAPQDEASIELGFTVTPLQKEIIEKNLKESECKDLNTYLQYIAQHGVVTSVVEVRSTGALDSILERIAKAKSK